MASHRVVYLLGILASYRSQYANRAHGAKDTAFDLLGGFIGNSFSLPHRLS